MNDKGVSVILSYVILLGLVITMVTITYMWANSEVEKAKSQNEIELSKKYFDAIDNALNEVLREGKFSSRTVVLSVNEGEFVSKSYSLYIFQDLNGNLEREAWEDIPFDPTTISFPNNFTTLSYEKSVESRILGVGNPVRTGNTVIEVSGTIEAYWFEIYESYVKITVEQETIGSLLHTYTTIFLSNFNNVVGQTSGTMSLYLQNAGTIVWTKNSNDSVGGSFADLVNGNYVVLLSNGERFIVEYDSVNERIFVKYTTDSTTMPITLETLILSKSPDIYHLKVIVTFLNANFGVIL